MGENRLNEQGYLEGQRAAMRKLLDFALRELGAGASDPQAAVARLTAEREETAAVLRRLGREIGAEDWPDDLHLADVVEKRIGRAIDRDDSKEAVGWRWNTSSPKGDGESGEPPLADRVLAVVRDRLLPAWAAGGFGVTEKIVNIAGDLVEMCGPARDPVR